MIIVNRFLVCCFLFFFLLLFSLSLSYFRIFPLSVPRFLLDCCCWRFSFVVVCVWVAHVVVFILGWSKEGAMHDSSGSFHSSSIHVSHSLSLSPLFRYFSQFSSLSLSLFLSFMCTENAARKTSFSVAALKRLFSILTLTFYLWISKATNDKITIHPIPIPDNKDKLKPLSATVEANDTYNCFDLCVMAMANRRLRRGLSAVFGGSLRWLSSHRIRPTWPLSLLSREW